MLFGDNPSVLTEVAKAEQGRDDQWDVGHLLLSLLLFLTTAAAEQLQDQTERHSLHVVAYYTGLRMKAGTSWPPYKDA